MHPDSYCLFADVWSGISSLTFARLIPTQEREITLAPQHCLQWDYKRWASCWHWKRRGEKVDCQLSLPPIKSLCLVRCQVMVEIDSSPGLTDQKMEGRGMWEQERRRGEGRLVQTSPVLHCCIQSHCSQVDVDIQLPTQPHWHGLGWGRVKHGDAEPPPPPLQIPHTRLPLAACLEWRLRTIRILLTIPCWKASFPGREARKTSSPFSPAETTVEATLFVILWLGETSFSCSFFCLQLFVVSRLEVPASQIQSRDIWKTIRKPRELIVLWLLKSQGP